MINWDEKPEWADRVVIGPCSNSYYWANSKMRSMIVSSHDLPNNDHITEKWKTIWPPSHNNEEHTCPSVDSGAHYRYQYKGINLDPYRIFKVYGITDPAMQHAIKKLLVAGSRGNKTTEQDIKESIDALNRKLEMDREDIQ